MFGLKNFSGSCWVNACLQSVFRIPEVQARYSASDFVPENTIDASLAKIWKSNGDDGLLEFFESVRNERMPAGHNIGDTHELMQHLCDKLVFLDKLCRFRIADAVICQHCKTKQLVEDSVTEYSITSDTTRRPISQCILASVQPNTIEDWTCEKCKQKGCTKQQLIGTFPKVMIFHMVSLHTPIDYSSILVLNGKKYALLSVSCHNGGHWWAYGRNMPPGSSWFTLDDTRVEDHGPKQFPLSSNMRVLIYYRLEE